MTTQHTPEPWNATDTTAPKGGFLKVEQLRLLKDREGTILALLPMWQNNAESASEAELNARRIVACVNALAHISTEQLESGEMLNLGQQVADLTKQRDELLAAAIMAVEMIEYEKHERRHVRWALKAAIAKATGQSNT